MNRKVKYSDLGSRDVQTVKPRQDEPNGLDQEEEYLEQLILNTLKSGDAIVGRAKVVSCAGPPGVGKSSVVGSLAETLPCYVERAEDNPHLENWLKGNKAFDALANQDWFLGQMEEMIRSADANEPLVLDQDPVGIVCVYADDFRRNAMLRNDDYVRLQRRVVDVAQRLSEWKGGRKMIVLDAPTSVLHERLMQDAQAAPPLDWVDRIRNRFLEYGAQPHVHLIDTRNRSIDDVAEEVKTIVMDA